MEPYWVEYVWRDLDIEFLPRRWEGRKLVHISDLHVGPSVDSGYLENVFHSIGKIEAEIIVITGDHISYRTGEEIDQLRKVLTKFPKGSKQAVAILGNHDYGPGWADFEVANEVRGALGDMGIIVLRNESIDIDGLNIVGMDDLWADNFFPEKALRGWDPSYPSVVLCHNPDALDTPGWSDYQGWILSGHTHGGQCKPPFLPPPVLPISNVKYASGEIPLRGGRKLYVNRGVGHLIPVRFNVRPEVTIFRLSRKTT
jgi:predicted MPP superfamily phosphohydrolase